MADAGSPADGGAGLDGSVPYVANAQQVCGTWVLNEINDGGSLTPALWNALHTPGVVGFSARFPWNVIDGNTMLLDASKAMATDAGVALSIRFMAGRFTPAWVFDAGSPYYLLDGGELVPLPFFPDGGPNTIFEAAYQGLATQLMTWSQANGVHLIHMGWYGQDYSELNNGYQVRGAPGYDAGWLRAHEDLVDIALASQPDAGPLVAVEFPLSGYGPLTVVSPELASYIVGQVGSANPRIFIQANGWGGSPPDGGLPFPDGGNVRDWGPTSDSVESALDTIWQQPICRGEQMIQPGPFDWEALYADLNTNIASYAEVYYQSFSGGDGGVQAQVAQFAARCAGQGVPLP